MARPLRIEYPGAIYHVLSRGDRREAIVKNDADREPFFELITGSILSSNSATPTPKLCIAALANC